MKNEPETLESRYEEEAKLMALLTFQMEKFCQEKEFFFATRFNLTPTEFRILRLIRELKSSTTKELSKSMKLTAGRITHLLNSLEEKKLVNRKSDKVDRRQVNCSLTKEAHPYIDMVITEYTKIHKDILKYLPADKRDEVIVSMTYFFEALKLYAENIHRSLPI